jgi:hypothetical protein
VSDSLLHLGKVHVGLYQVCRQRVFQRVRVNIDACLLAEAPFLEFNRN